MRLSSYLDLEGCTGKQVLCRRQIRDTKRWYESFLLPKAEGCLPCSQAKKPKSTFPGNVPSSAFSTPSVLNGSYGQRLRRGLRVVLMTTGR